MSRRRGDQVEPGDLPYALFRRAAVPAFAAATMCVVIAAVVTGWAGLVGSLIGTAIVAAFYGTDLLTLRFAERLDGQVLMPLMLTEYMIKVIALAMLFAIFWDTTAFDMKVMALTVACATIVWTIALAVSAARAATFVVDVSAHRSSDKS